MRDDRALFEMLILEGAHAGLSWETVWKKRAGYRTRFHGVDMARVAAMTDDDRAGALTYPGIVHHREGCRRHPYLGGPGGRFRSFAGLTIVRAYPQPVGVVRDHWAGCRVRRGG